MEIESYQHTDTNSFKSENERLSMQSYETKLDFENVPVPKDLKELCEMLHKVFAMEAVNIEYAQRIIENYKSNPKDWRKYAKYDPHKYTRNLIDEGNGKFNILLLCWAESQGSSIHDHSDAHCFMKCLDGELLETKYKWPDTSNSTSIEETEMIATQKSALKKNECCYINDTIGLHRIENESHSKPAITLHVYIPPYTECQGFDQQTSKSKTCQITFYSKYGNKI